MTAAIEAIRLHQLGLNVVPVRDGTKMPTVPWMELQTRRATSDEVQTWFSKPEGLGFGVLCGEVSSGLIALDFDQPEGYARWKQAHPDLAATLPTAVSGRGIHVFATSPGLRSGPLVLAGESSPVGDVLSERKLCVLPPTRHPSGRPRQWLNPLHDLPQTLTAEQLGLAIKGQPKRAMEANSGKGAVYGQGERHSALTSIGGTLRNLGLDQGSISVTLHQVNSSQCHPPLDAPEVESIARWAGSAGINPPYRTRARDDDYVGVVVPPGNCAYREDEGWELEDLFLPLGRYLTESPAAEVQWIVEDFLPVGYLVILGGTSKAGKSCFVTSMGLHIAAGESFMGQEVTQAPVLWCALEESESERRISLEAYDGPNPDAFYISHAKFSLDDPEDIRKLRWWIRKTGAKLLVIDPLYAASKAESLGDGIAARRVLQPLKDLCRDEQCSAVVIHHLTKNVGAGMTRERFADSNQLLAAASMDVLMDSSDLADGSREIHLRCRGRGTFANQTWVVRSSQMGEYQVVRHGTDVEKGQESCDHDILEVLTTAEEPLTAFHIAEATGLKAKTVQNRLTVLQREGQVTTEGKDGRANLYRAA